MRKLSTEDFKERAIIAHKGKYDYSKVEYKGSREKVEIVCPKHGSFFQTPDKHLNKKDGCPRCANETRNTPKTTNQFILEAKEIHKEEYDYSKTSYINNCTKVTIICKKHGEFLQSPSHHLAGNGCPECSKEKISKALRGSWEELEKRFIAKYGNKYDYSKVEYKSVDTKVKIYCKECQKYFWQTPYNHLDHEHKECCGNSRAEKIICSFLKKNGINYIAEHTFSDLKDKGFLRYDFYLPEKNLLIEYDGAQHFLFPNTLHKSRDEFESQQKRDKLKTEYAEKNNINLLRINYKDFDNILAILQEKLII